MFRALPDCLVFMGLVAVIGCGGIVTTDGKTGVEDGGVETSIDTQHTCAKASDCGDPSTTVCDPVSLACLPATCTAGSTTNECGKGLVCVPQDDKQQASHGACFATCTPFSASVSCPEDYNCVSTRHDQESGICVPVGIAVTGMPCIHDAVNTGCVKGNECLNLFNPYDGGTALSCAQECNYFSPNPGCTKKTDSCSLGGSIGGALGGVCLDTYHAGESVQIGEPCVNGWNACAPSNGGFRGLCAVVSDTWKVVCEQACRHNVPADCASGYACTTTNYPWFSTTIGTCGLAGPSDAGTKSK